MNALVSRASLSLSRVIAVLLCTFVFATVGVAQDLEIENYSLVGKTRVSRTDFEYTYTAQAVNTGSDYQNVVASLSSASPHTTVVDGDLQFGTVASGTTVTSSDTFTIRQNRRYAFSWANMSWDVSFDQPAPPPEGVLLEGNPNSLAIDALTLRPPQAVDDSQILNNVILSRLTAAISRGATVGDTNQALLGINGRILSMQPGLEYVTIAIPIQPSIDAIAEIARNFAASPAFRSAFPARTPSPAIVPPGHTVPSIERDTIQHLMSTRFPAAWNAANLIEVDDDGNCLRPVTVLVADFWYKAATMLQTYKDAAVDQLLIPKPNAIIPLSTQPDRVYDPPNDAFSGLHGYDVMSTMGANFDTEPPTGSMPVAACFKFVGVPLNGYSWRDVMVTLRNRFPSTDKFLINTSLEFPNDYQEPIAGPADVAVVTRPIVRADLALLWRRLISPSFLDTTNYEDRFLLLSAAGNGADRRMPAGPFRVFLGDFYPGVIRAEYSNPFSIAARGGPLLGFAADATLWGPTAGFPDLTATAAEMQFLRNELAFWQVDHELNNVLVVGSTSNEEVPDDSVVKVESVFSDRGADVYAVGENIPSLDALGRINGTSFSAPTVTGLAAYLWLIAPDLRDDGIPASITRDLIQHSVNRLVTTAQGNDINLIDAYRAALTFDLDPTVIGVPAIQFGEAPVRNAVLDIDGDGYFEEDDVQRFLWAYYDGDFLDPDTLPIEPLTRDYSRFDLNGDGFTGGSIGGCDGVTPRGAPGCTEQFDLDLLATPELTPVYDSNVEGLFLLPPISDPVIEEVFDETILTDFEILCYYTFSPLYYGDFVGINALQGRKWLSDCVDIETSIDVPLADVHFASTVQLVGNLQETGGPTLIDGDDWSGGVFRWASSNTDVAVIDNRGRMHINGPGTVTIRASYGRSFAETTLNVPFEEPKLDPEEVDYKTTWQQSGPLGEGCYQVSETSPHAVHEIEVTNVQNPIFEVIFYRGLILPDAASVSSVDDPAIIWERLTGGYLPREDRWLKGVESGDLILIDRNGGGFAVVEIESISEKGPACPFANYKVHNFKSHVPGGSWPLWELDRQLALPYEGGIDEDLWIHIAPPVPMLLDAGTIDLNNTGSGAALKIEIAEESDPDAAYAALQIEIGEGNGPDAVNIEAVAPWAIQYLPALNPIDERENIAVILRLGDVFYEVDVDLTVNNDGEMRNLVVNDLVGWRCDYGTEQTCPSFYRADVLVGDYP